MLQGLEYVGVAHYRRHFSLCKNKKSLDYAITGSQLENLLAGHISETIIATPKRSYISSVEDHYIHSLKGYESIHAKDISRLRQAVHDVDPGYDSYADAVLLGKRAHMLNMFIMGNENFSRYCQWLFSVIDEVVLLSRDREDQRRYAGALSEFCLDIWVGKNALRIIELPLLETEQRSFFVRFADYVKRKL